jgi:hypothetical protein
MAIFVRRNRSLEVGWQRAGGTRRLATLVWASGYLMTNGDLGGRIKESGITAQDMIPAGLDNAQKSDVAQLHAQLANWFNYWTMRYPSDTLEQAMLNLIVRLSKAKAGWIAERSDPFPFNRAIASACQGRFEQYVDGKV